ncbi:hypothetical protein [Nonomuraea sp. B19D2]|uniref:hypothetical protein n=1 Tax=Nonomuraea sp. B19D2 TaxID=3159561 RepID=UPI0032DAB289
MAWRPVLALLLMAPYLGEVLSTATSPLELLVPWNLVVLDALVGLGGRYDLTLGAVLTALVLAWLHRRVHGRASGAGPGR